MASRTWQTDSLLITQHDDGLLHAVAVAHEHTLERARSNLALVRELARGARVPLVLDVRQVQGGTPSDVQRLYAGESPAMLSAFALVVNGAVGRMLGNIAMSMARLGRDTMPMRLFEAPEPALVWARQQGAGHVAQPPPR